MQLSCIDLEVQHLFRFCIKLPNVEAGIVLIDRREGSADEERWNAPIVGIASPRCLHPELYSVYVGKDLGLDDVWVGSYQRLIGANVLGMPLRREVVTA